MKAYEPLRWNTIRCRWSACFCALCCAVLLTACGDIGLDDRELVQKAKDYMERRDPAAAWLELKNALLENPDNAEARFLLGGIEYRFGNMESARSAFEAAERGGWNTEEAAIGRARALLRLGDFDGLINGIRIDGAWSDDSLAAVHGMRASAFNAQGKREEATSELAAAQARNADGHDVMEAQARLLLAAGGKNAAAALDIVSRALERHPGDPDLLLLGAGTALEAGKEDQAVRLLQDLLAGEPAVMTEYGRRARLFLAQLHIKNDSLEQAEKVIAPLLKYNIDPQTRYLEALLFYRKGQLDKAEDSLRQVLKLTQNAPDAGLLMGVVNFQQRDYEQAAYYLNRYVATHPDNINAVKLLSRTYLLRGQPEEARRLIDLAGKEEGAQDAELLALGAISALKSGDIAAGLVGLERAVSAAPGDAALQEQLARVYLSTGRTEQAIATLQALLDRNDSSRDAGILLVIASLQADDKQTALQSMQRLLEQEPDAPGLLTMMGNVQAVVGDRIQARHYLERAVEQDPGYFFGVLSLARLEDSENRVESATGLYRRAIEISDALLPMLAFADFNHRIGRAGEARSWYQKVREKYPDNIQSRLYLADQALRGGRTDEARLMVDEMLGTAPQQTVVAIMESQVLIAEKRYQDALRRLESLRDRTPAKRTPAESLYDVRIMQLLGVTYQSLGKDAEAGEVYRDILKTDAGNLMALNNLAWLLVRAGDPEAVEMARRAHRIEPSSPSIQDTLGWALIRNGQFAEGKRFVALALEKLGDNPEVRYHYAVALLKTGDVRQGNDIIKDLLENHPAFEGREEAMRLVR